MKTIEISHLTKRYGKHRGIEDVTFAVKAGEIFGFIGQNGAGKSTTIRILMHFLFPNEGHASILGYACEQENSMLKEKVAYIPSEVALYDTIRVKDLFAFTRKINQRGSEQEMLDLCSYFSLDPNRMIRELSLGNRKKVSIIQALLRKPDVYILDEPTSGLDPIIQDKLFKKLLEERANGKTIFLSSHNLAEVETYCDRVAILKNGKLLQVFSMDEIRKKQGVRICYETEQGKVEQEYHGDINKIIQTLSKEKLLSLHITPISLEETFLRYYEEDTR